MVAQGNRKAAAWYGESRGVSHENGGIGCKCDVSNEARIVGKFPAGIAGASLLLDTGIQKAILGATTTGGTRRKVCLLVVLSKRQLPQACR